MSELTMMCFGNIKENGVIFGERLNHQSSISVSEMLRLTLTWWTMFQAKSMPTPIILSSF